MRLRDRLAMEDVQLLADFATLAASLQADLSISGAKKAAAIAQTNREILTQLEERGQLTEPVAKRILAQAEAALAHCDALTREAADAITQLVARFEPQVGVVDRLRLLYEEKILPWWEDDSF